MVSKLIQIQTECTGKLDRIEDLMLTFKPASYNKLPGIVVVMDPDIAIDRTHE